MKDEPDLKNSFEDIVNAYYQPLYRFGVSLSKSEATAADLTQETFRTFATKGSDIRDRSKVKSWLFTTLYREFLRIRRRSERIDHYEPEVLEASMGASPSEARRKHDAHLAMDALDSVDEKFREPLALFYIEDLSYKEIAEILDLPIGTVMSRLNRGKGQLRAAFKVDSVLRKNPERVN